MKILIKIIAAICLSLGFLLIAGWLETYSHGRWFEPIVGVFFFITGLVFIEIYSAVFYRKHNIEELPETYTDSVHNELALKINELIEQNHD